MKSRTYENAVNRQQYVCDDPQDIREIDGVSYLTVREPNSQRTFLMRKDTLRTIDKRK